MHFLEKCKIDSTPFNHMENQLYNMYKDKKINSTTQIYENRFYSMYNDKKIDSGKFGKMETNQCAN